jgi:NAD(P)H-hydrate epimerase
MVAARHLSMHKNVTIIYDASPTMTSQTEHQLNLLRQSGVHLLSISANVAFTIPPLLKTIKADLIIDSLLGIGAHSPLNEPYHTLVQIMHELHVTRQIPILSVDIPTPGITADLTVSFHRPKTEDALTIAIGIPLLADIAVGPGDLARLPQRSSAAHKGHGGKVLVIGGGPYQGAPYLAACAALRAGADLVTVYSPVPSPCMDIIWIPSQGKYIDTHDLHHLKKHIKSADVVILGNGLGKTTSESILSEIIQQSDRIVCDADALIGPYLGKQETILTPHMGEFARITGRSAESIPSCTGDFLAARAELVCLETQKIINEAQYTTKNNVNSSTPPCTILLKGSIDIISDGRRVRFNDTGTSALTVGGTGDVLAGVCGALLCHLSGYHAASLASWVVGSCGEQLEKTRGYGLLASDILEVIPAIIKNI